MIADCKLSIDNKSLTLTIAMLLEAEIYSFYSQIIQRLCFAIIISALLRGPISKVNKQH